jgi:hypothetical protein
VKSEIETSDPQILETIAVTDVLPVEASPIVVTMKGTGTGDVADIYFEYNYKRDYIPRVFVGTPTRLLFEIDSSQMFWNFTGASTDNGQLSVSVPTNRSIVVMDYATVAGIFNWAFNWQLSGSASSFLHDPQVQNQPPLGGGEHHPHGAG